MSESTTVSGTGLASSAGGTVGVNGAQPNYPATSSTASVVSGVIVQNDNATTYLYNQVEQQVEDKGGSIKNLTIGVILNSAQQAVSTADPQQIQQFVAYAVGTTPDKVNVQMTRFATTPTASTPSKSTTPGGVTLPTGQALLWLVGAILIAAVLVLLLVFFYLRRRKKARQLAEQQAEEERLALEKQQEEEAKKKEPVLETNLEDVAQDPVKQQINDFADNKPELVAQLLRNWLKD